MAARLSRTVRLRITIGFVTHFLDALVTAYMAIHFATVFGLGLTGVLIIAATLVGIVALFVGGHVAEQQGRRPALLIAQSVVLCSFVAMFVSDTAVLGPWVLYGGYLLNRLGMSFGAPANDAVIVDATDRESRRHAYTVNYWALNLAIAGGSLIGAWLYSGGAFWLMLLTGAVGAGAVLVTTALFIPETRPTPATPTAPTTTAPAPPHRRRALRAFIGDYRVVLTDRTYITLLVAAMLTISIEFQLTDYIGIRLGRDVPHQPLLPFLGITAPVTGVQLVGLLRAENTLMVVALALVVTRLFGRLSDRRALYLGVTLFVVGYMVVAVSDTPWVLLIGCAVFTIGELMNSPVAQTLMANIIPDHSRSRYLAVSNLAFLVAQLVAALFVSIGAVVPPLGIAGLYGAMGVVVILCIRYVLRVQDRSPAPQLDQASEVPGVS